MHGLSACNAPYYSAALLQLLLMLLHRAMLLVLHILPWLLGQWGGQQGECCTALFLLGS